MQNIIGKNCPYCQFPFKMGVSVVFCSACGVPHHQECWNENNGCTTYGCKSSKWSPGDRKTGILIFKDQIDKTNQPEGSCLGEGCGLGCIILIILSILGTMCGCLGIF